MGYLISDGFYNGEVNSYTYFGGEPNYNTLHEWGHFSQIVWVNTQEVGCYTSDCTASGLGNVDPSTGIRPYLTVCNYGLPGKFVLFYFLASSVLVIRATMRAKNHADLSQVIMLENSEQMCWQVLV